MAKKTGFWNSVGKFIDAVAEAQTVAKREVAYDEATGTVRVIETMVSGRKQVRTFVEADTVSGTRKARECGHHTPVGACEDRNCFYHRNEPAEKRPNLI